MWASSSTTIFMQHCLLAAVATLHLHCWFSSTQKCTFTVNLSIVPIYTTSGHITELVWITRNETKWASSHRQSTWDWSQSEPNCQNPGSMDTPSTISLNRSAQLYKMLISTVYQFRYSSVLRRPQFSGWNHFVAG